MVKALFPIMMDGQSGALRRIFGAVALGSLLLIAVPLSLSAKEQKTDVSRPPMQQDVGSGDEAQDTTQLPALALEQPGVGDDQTSIFVETTTKPGDQPKLDVTVNGQAVTVPKNGTYKERTHQDNGTTIVDVKVEGNNSASTHANSSTSIQVQTQSYSAQSNIIGDEGRHPTRRKY